MKKYLGVLMVLGLCMAGASSAHAFNFAGLQRELTASAIDSIQSIASTNTKVSTDVSVKTDVAAPVLSLKATDTVSQVKAVQQTLVNAGLLAKKYVTGYFGSLTDAALKQYQSQAKSGAPASGGSTGGDRSPIQNPSLMNPCTITVTSPNGGEIFTVGQQTTVAWSSTCPSTDAMQVRLYNQAGQGITLNTTNLYNSGSLAVTIPAPTFAGITTYGLHYKVRVIDLTSGATISDYSDNMFTINQSCGNMSYAVNSAYSNQTVSPNTAHFKIGSYVIQNQSTCEPFRVTNLNVGVNQNPLGNLSSLVTSETSGSGSTPIQPAANGNNNFAVNFILAPGASRTIDIFADIGSASSGYVQTNFTINGIWFNTNAPLGNGFSSVLGQMITIGTTTLNTPTLIMSQTTQSQYIAAANGATDATEATYNFVASGGSATINELRFTVTGTNTISSVRIAGVSGVSAVPNGLGVATFTGLNIPVPNGPAGVSVSVYISYSTVPATIPSGALSRIALSYVKYVTGGTTSTMCLSSCTTTMNAIIAPTMMLVGSKPTFTVSQPTSSILVNGQVELIDVTVTADPQGAIKMSILPIQMVSNNASFSTAANSIVVKDSNNNTIPTTNAPLVGGATTIYLTGYYQITAGTSQTFKIFTTATGVTGPAGTATIATMLGNVSLMDWFDWAGGNMFPFATENLTYLYNWPISTSIVHN